MQTDEDRLVVLAADMDGTVFFFPDHVTVEIEDGTRHSFETVSEAIEALREEEYDEDICWCCSGSGEGRHEGEWCRVCGGSGILYKEEEE